MSSSKEVILYPTETVYGLGVHAFDEEALAILYTLKGRDEGKKVSWLVPTVEHIEHFGILSPVARRIADAFLPGSLTLVVPVHHYMKKGLAAPDGTIGFRVSPDRFAQEVIKEWFLRYDAPLTCTSANVSGEEPKDTPEAILTQFGERVSLITKVVDDGPRMGTPSTVVRVVDDEVSVIREGAISKEKIEECVRNGL